MPHALTIWTGARACNGGGPSPWDRASIFMSRDDQTRPPDPSPPRRDLLSGAMADAVPILISYVDSDERYRFVNRAYERWFGVDRAQIEGRPLREVVGDVAYARLAGHVRRALAGETLIFEGEVEYQGAGVRFIEARYVPDITPDGEIPGYYALITDITDRKRAEETERLLIREVDHRAKNVLTVVQSLAQLTPFESKDQYVQALSGRIGSLARAHSLLSTTRWSGVDLHDLLELELDPYGGEAGEQIAILGPPALIDAQAAQSLALVVHELATNASKYGALSRPLGRLNVSWGFGDAGVLHLTWREDAGASVAAPTQRGFGSTLIQSAVKQLGARIEHIWRPQGLKVRLDLLSGAQPRPAEGAPVYRPGLSAEGDTSLEDQHVLIVEDEAVVAMELTRMLSAAGATVVGPAGTIEEALALLDAHPVDCALLDVNLGGLPITPVAHALHRLGVPFVYLTGYQEPAVDDAPILRKPVPAHVLLGALARGTQLTTQ
ncbi:HWE histidine kinase domain-containing protein [Caulobacter vibrioides]|uniref:HWE histidine kinase domain-containing protein n=1 Tax=Caulobacter vibrioides TaxID=155892 RepID=UPI0013DDAE8D|nr:HWE histidine kinase domain-containing protein [Caulobacter vibrioides]